MLRLRCTWLLLAVVAALIALTAAACGVGEEAEGTRTPSASGTPAGTPRPTASPAGAMPGVTDTEIVLGSHAALTGTYGAVYTPVIKGLQAYFDYVNAEKGGVCGRKVVLRTEDDQFDPALAMDAIRKLVEQDKIFAAIAGVGTAAHSAVWEYLNERGIPDLWPITGAHKWGADPKAHPWTVAAIPDYFVEATIYGKYISEHYPGKKVGILYQNDDFGRDQIAGLTAGLDPSKNQIVSQQSYETTAVDVRSQVTNLKDAGAEVALCSCIPGYTAQAIKGANRMGWKPQWIVSLVNSDPVMFQYASPQDMEGTLSAQADKLIEWTDDPAIAEHLEIMRKYGGGAPGNFSVVGQLVGELTVEALNRTCDDLTREGVIKAVESIKEYQSDLVLPGITFTFSADDHIGAEALRLIRAKIKDGKGVWEYEGEIIPFRR